MTRLRVRTLRRANVLALALVLVILTAACSRIAPPEGWSAGVVKGDALIIGTAEGSILAVDKNDGSTLWRRELQVDEEVDQAIYGRPAVSDAMPDRRYCASCPSRRAVFPPRMASTSSVVKFTPYCGPTFGRSLIA